MAQRNEPRSSNPWKNQRLFFQCLEKTGKNFPRFGTDCVRACLFLPRFGKINGCRLSLLPRLGKIDFKMKKTRIDKKFAALKKEGKKGFIAYIGAGDPNLDDTVDIVLKLEEAGVDVVELGLPFSDPLADGRVNQDAATRALEAGSTFDGVMDCVRKIRETSQIPLIFYAYLNTLTARGFDQSMAEAAAAGIDGFLILDMPREESGPYKGAVKSANLNNIVLITPTTP